MAGFFDKFKKTKAEKKPEGKKEAEVKVEKPKEIKKKEIKEEKTETKVVTKKAKKDVGGRFYKILLEPLVTEKAADLGADGKYVFIVAKDANKVEIAKAIESVYGTKPVKVNIVNMRGKKVRYGKITGKKKNWKKAVVTLKPGEKIEVYEGV